MDRDLDFMRQQVEYLERVLENCMAHIASLEARVAELERRPVAVPPLQEAGEQPRSRRSVEEEELVEVFHGATTFWESPRYRRR
jgi:hypothetical protein